MKNEGKKILLFIVGCALGDFIDDFCPKFFFISTAAAFFIIFLMLRALVQTYLGKLATEIGCFITLFNLIDELFGDPTARGWNDWICFIILLIVFIIQYKRYKAHQKLQK